MDQKEKAVQKDAKDVKDIQKREKSPSIPKKDGSAASKSLPANPNLSLVDMPLTLITLTPSQLGLLPQNKLARMVIKGRLSFDPSIVESKQNAFAYISLDSNLLPCIQNRTQY